MQKHSFELGILQHRRSTIPKEHNRGDVIPVRPLLR